MNKIRLWLMLSVLCASQNTMATSMRAPESTVTLYPMAAPEAGLEAAAARTDALSNSIRVLEREIRTKLRSQHSSIPRVILLGITGSGKTSLIHALVGKTLTVKRGRGHMLLEAAPSQRIPNLEIGHSVTSQTTAPVSWYDAPTGLSYWDCPGFTDTRGPDQDIINAFAIDQIFEAPSRIKSLLVLQQSELVDSRSLGTFERFNKLMRVMPDQNQLYQSVVLVVTKTRDDFSVHEFLSSLEDIPNPLLQFFIRHPERVFSFPCPSVSADGSVFNLFTDKDAVINALRNNIVVNPTHNVDLDPRSLVSLVETAKELGDLKKHLFTLSESIRAASNNTSPEELRGWGGFLKRFLELPNTQIDTPDKLMHQMVTVTRIPNATIAQQSLDHVSVSWRFRNLLQKIQLRDCPSMSMETISIAEILKPLLQNTYDSIQVQIKQNETIEQERRRVLNLSCEIERRNQEMSNQERLYAEQLRQTAENARAEKKRLETELNRQVANGNMVRAEADRQIEQFRKETQTAKEKIQQEWAEKQRTMEASHQQVLNRLEREKAALVTQDRTTKAALEAVQENLETIRRAQRTAEEGFERRLEAAKREVAEETKNAILRQLFRPQPIVYLGGGGFY